MTSPTTRSDAPEAAGLLQPPSRTRLGLFADLAWLVARTAQEWPWLAVAAAGSAVAQGLLVPATLWLTKLLVDALAQALSTPHASAGTPWSLWIGLLAACLLIGRVLGGLQGWTGTVTAERIGPAYQERVMARAAELYLLAFEHQDTYDRLYRILQDAEGRVPQALGQLIELGQSLPATIGYAASLALVSPLLAVAAVAATVPTVIAWTVMGQAGWGVTVAVTRQRRLRDYYASILTSPAAAAEVRLFGLTDHLLARWTEHYWDSIQRWREGYNRNGNLLRAATTASVGSCMFGLWIVATRVLPHAAAGTYTLLLQSVVGLFGAIFQLGQTLNRLGEHSGYAGELRGLLQERSGVATPGAEPDAAPFPSPLRHGIRFEGVWFTYPGASAPTLAGVDLSIGAGETVALVGENGAGKTTLTKLLLGLYRPDAGRITVDGVDVTDLDPASYRAAVSAVFQQFVRYPLTFGENVGIGMPAAMGDDARIRHATARSGAQEALDALGGGYDTLLGPDIGGVDLSGGQWQRLALARAYFRSAPHADGVQVPLAAQVLVLDEPTAALDPMVELALFERFVELAAERTTVLVSHRLGVCRLADRVVVMSGGRVVEEGPHDRLVAAGGKYAALFSAQARWYV